MAVGGRGSVTVRVNQAELNRLVTEHGPLGPQMLEVAQLGTQLAKRNAPVGQPSKTPEGHPAGWLRSSIGWDMRKDGRDLVIDFVADAVTSSANPFPGEPYPLHLEDPSTRPRNVPSWIKSKEGPFIRPAVEEAMQRVLGVVVRF